MVRLRVRNEETGDESVAEFGSFPVVMGRSRTCTVVLTDPSKVVSNRHCQLCQENGRLTLEDLGSVNRTLLNDRPLAPHEPAACASGDSIRVGPYLLHIADGSEPRPQAAPPRPKPRLTAADEQLFAYKQRVHRRFFELYNRKKSALEGLSESDFRDKVRDMTIGILDEPELAVPAGWTREAMLCELLDYFLGLGPLEDFLSDETVTEIMVNGKDHVYVERAGKLLRTDTRFLDDGDVQTVIQRIIQPLGRRIDDSQPYVNARLKDGSRVHAIIPPLALDGSILTIRKFAQKKLTIEDLIEFGAMSRPIADFLESMVRNRANILVSGGTGSGKTTLLNVLSNFIPDGERIVTVEDSAELRLNNEHVVRLEARPTNIEGKGEVSIRDLVRETLRMRPDRIVVGECRGGEALDMLQAMNTGHDGSLTTIHANNPRDTLNRLETLVLMAGMDLPSRAIREQIAAAINFIVQTARLADGSRKVTYITEITGMEANSTFTTQDIFLFRQEGLQAGGRVTGRFVPTGNVPKFTEKLRDRGIGVNMEVFSAA